MVRDGAPRVVGLVPARGGSKGVPRKNVRVLGDRPLLAYTAEAALAARRLDRVVLSTDDAAIAALGRQLGLEVPFIRPLQLAADDTPMIDVVVHALGELEARGGYYEVACLLQPTTPFRQPGLIDQCIEELERSGADSVMTVVEVPAEHNPHWVYFAGPDGSLQLSTGERDPVTRRQELPTAYCREGSVYVSRRETIVEGHSLYGQRTVGVLVDPETTVNIDLEADWERAISLLATVGRRP